MPTGFSAYYSPISVGSELVILVSGEHHTEISMSDSTANVSSGYIGGENPFSIIHLGLVFMLINDGAMPYLNRVS